MEEKQTGSEVVKASGKGAFGRPGSMPKDSRVSRLEWQEHGEERSLSGRGFWCMENPVFGFSVAASFPAGTEITVHWEVA